MNRKKVLIVFPYLHLPYSPSTLNLFYALKRKNFDVLLLAPEPEAHFSLQKIQDQSVQYINQDKKVQPLLQRVYKKVINHVISKGQLSAKMLMSGMAIAFIKEIEKNVVDIIIAVDFFSLWCVQQAGKSAHLLSLEILEDDPYYQNCNLSSILSVIIQSEKRYKYIFNGVAKPPFSIVPNSSALIDFVPDFNRRQKFNLIYCGSASIEFGIFSCLDFISDFPEYKLTVKGAMPENTLKGIEKFYAPLLENKRLIINDQYMDAMSLTYFIADFWAGFALYDFYRFPFLRRFNYYTAPSGKLFQYFNSGVPVIGNSLEGFDVVKKFNTGRLISCLGSFQIKKALDSMEEAYNEIASNAKRISYDFDPTGCLNNFIDKFMDPQ